MAVIATFIAAVFADVFWRHAVVAATSADSLSIVLSRVFEYVCVEVVLLQFVVTRIACPSYTLLLACAAF